MNEDRTRPESRTKRAQSGSRDVRFQLISPTGHRLGIYDTALEAASAAGGFWPGVGQKDDDNPEGWDLQVEGAAD